MSFAFSGSRDDASAASHLETLPFLAASISNLSIMSQLINELDSKYPLPYRHLKRVKRYSTAAAVLLWPESLSFHPSAMSATDAELLQKYSIAPEQLFVAKVLKHAPRTKEHWREGNLIWPVTLHIQLPKFPSWDSFDASYRQFVISHIKTPAVLFEPDTLRIIVALDEFSSCERLLMSPLKHATMLLLDKLAGIPKEQLKKDHYFATGYDLILQEEPCVMCSMALLHSRIRRVFFARNNTKMGGLGGMGIEALSVHTNPLLNHHFGAYCFIDN